MPIGEEEQRRRCIIDPSTCQEGLTQEAALAEALARYDSPRPEVTVTGSHYRMAKGLLQDFTLADRRGEES